MQSKILPPRYGGGHNFAGGTRSQLARAALGALGCSESALGEHMQPGCQVRESESSLWQIIITLLLLLLGAQHTHALLEGVVDGPQRH
jgi:hypothetical protein